MYDLIIVGAGPAGLTAALYAGRTKKSILILEANVVGGQILKANKIVNYPGIPMISGFDFITNLYNQVDNLGVKIEYESVIRIDEHLKVYTSKHVYQAKAIILSTGAENKKINLPRENELIGKGISYCATCDGSFYKDKTVAVYGEEKTALEDSLYLSDFVKKIYLITRKELPQEEEKIIVEINQKENIQILKNSYITKLLGEEQLEEIEIENIEHKLTRLSIDGLFIVIGQTPKNEIFKNIVELDEAGYILSEDGVHTSHPKIYVAGDTRVKDLRQLTTAISDGAIAATTALKEMEE